MRQQEKPTKEVDPTGLFNVLKNIQNRRCSTGYLCIEIGAIYGDFSQLNPRNITVPFNINRNVHFVIKPIIIVNNTADNRPLIPVTPVNPGIKPVGPNHPQEINKTELIKYFDADDDCEELRYFGNSQEVSNSKKINPGNQSSANFNRFKETESSMFSSKSKSNSQQYRMKDMNFNKIQRKFYRKVAIAEQVYTQDTFKQGLNLIILQRDKKYTKCKTIKYYFNNF